MASKPWTSYATILAVSMAVLREGLPPAPFPVIADTGT